MDKATAQRVRDVAQHALGQLDSSIHAVQASCSQQEFETFRTVVGKIMGAIVIDVLQPLYAEHPDITPPELK
jgi:DNA-binding transcriptional LysR family regulator